MESQRLGTLKLGPATTLTIVEKTAGQLAVEAVYGPGGSPPPNHLHPDQDEYFKVLEGSMQVRMGDAVELEIFSGNDLEVPRGTPHTMWNGSAKPARLRWVTAPAGRTEEWFRALDAIQRQNEEGHSDPQALARLLEEYSDVFRLVLP